MKKLFHILKLLLLYKMNFLIWNLPSGTTQPGTLWDMRYWLRMIRLPQRKFIGRILEQYPRNGWSMYGLIQALEAQGKDASDVQQRFDTIWGRADVALNASRL